MDTPKQKRGFAAMSPEKQREIASKGGKAAHQKGAAHEWTPEAARAAGRKGGLAVSRDVEHMARIGREGGFANARRRPDWLQRALTRTSTPCPDPDPFNGADADLGNPGDF